MCKVLKLPRSTYYYEAREQADETELIDTIIAIFHESRQNYGTRRIRKELNKKGMQISRRRIGRIMKENGLVSRYTVANYKPHKTTYNEDLVQNELNREFDQKEKLAVVVSDLTYVRVASKWNYICLLIDLFNREIIGYSTGVNKDAPLVYRAFSKIKGNLENICLFHTDRGKEFKNKLIDEALNTFNIKRSLSMKGCPYDNAVAEATFKTIKVEFIYGRNFSSLDELAIELEDYVNWFNNKRLHSTLGYLSPIDYKTRNQIITA